MATQQPAPHLRPTASLPHPPPKNEPHPPKITSHIHTKLTDPRSLAPNPQTYLTPHWRTHNEALALIQTLTGHTSLVMSVAVTPDGRRVVSGSSDQTVKVWNLSTGEEELTLMLDSPVLSLTISPDGKTIVVGDQLGNVYCLSVVAVGS